MGGSRGCRRGGIGMGSLWVKILSEEQHRALAFVECCNANGHMPTASDLAVWLASPRPKGAQYELSESMSRLSSASTLRIRPCHELSFRPTPTPADHARQPLRVHGQQATPAREHDSDDAPVQWGCPLGGWLRGAPSC